MSTKRALEELVTALGGTPTGMDTSELIEDLAKAMNPLAKLTVDVGIDTDTDLLGKTIEDLQEGVYVKGHSIYGTLKAVTGYTGFSGLEEEQSGHYLVIHASVPDETGVTISVRKSSDETSKNLDADGILIFRVKNKATKLVFTASKSGQNSFTKELDLSNLVLK